MHHLQSIYTSLHLPRHYQPCANLSFHWSLCGTCCTTFWPFLLHCKVHSCQSGKPLTCCCWKVVLLVGVLHLALPLFVEGLAPVPVGSVQTLAALQQNLFVFVITVQLCTVHAGIVPPLVHSNICVMMPDVTVLTLWKVPEMMSISTEQYLHKRQTVWTKPSGRPVSLCKDGAQRESQCPSRLIWHWRRLGKTSCTISESHLGHLQPGQTQSCLSAFISHHSSKPYLDLPFLST